MSKLSNWRTNKAKAIYNNTEPTLTDQAGANDTDINVIVSQFGIHGQTVKGPHDPIYGDFSGMPTDLRATIELARGVDYHRSRLPEALRDLTTEELLALTPDTLREKLRPAEKPADEPKEEAK